IDEFLVRVFGEWNFVDRAQDPVNGAVDVVVHHVADRLRCAEVLERTIAVRHRLSLLPRRELGLIADSSYRLGAVLLGRTDFVNRIRSATGAGKDSLG